MGSYKEIIQSWFEEELIIPDIEATSFEEVLKILSESLHRKGYVKDGFYEKLIERERNFPTGLPVEGDVKAAIPHASPEYVNKSAIAVGILKKPVTFVEMGTRDRFVECRIVFLLAIKDSKRHLEVLKRLMDFFVNSGNLERIVKARDRKVILHFILDNLNGDGR
ncbi:PTS sugar transporter subunit IIA [Thermoanaerobacterium sp. DL9XJH110]|uniref:PTS sugar transporter subunit IIA n=1 Tax=Thermoanaerobacterium sp. DL9XJH110 TaxID=3386643 RepID=UPI003BB75F15